MKNKKSCKNCKYYPMGNHWPCVDCDMLVHDRWEKPGNNSPKIKEGEVGMKMEIDDAYKRGAEDAWETAKKIVLPGFLGGYSIDKLQEIFETSSFSEIFKDIGCLEAIEKIRQYEEREKDFQVGDEVTNEFGFYAVVARTDVDDDESQMYLMFNDGSCGENDKAGWTKTGRHFPQIAEVLEKMDEAMNEKEK